MSNAVTVAGALPAMPLVVVGESFMRELASLEIVARSALVDDAASAQDAGNLLGALTKAGKDLDLARETVKAPFLKACRDIDAAPKPIALRIDQAKTVIRKKLTDYQVAEQTAAAERERQRLAEISRLEKLKKEEADRLAKEADELLKQAAASGAKIIEEPDFETDSEPAPKTATEIALDAVKFAPAIVAPKPIGVAFRCTLRVKAIQVEALPSHFVVKTADEVAIRRTYCQPWKEGAPLPVCPGVVFEIDRTPVSTGRNF